MKPYNCHSTPTGFRVTRFDKDLNVEASYTIITQGSRWNCSCPQGHKPTCKHRKMVNEFVLSNNINSMNFWDADTGQWCQPFAHAPAQTAGLMAQLRASAEAVDKVKVTTPTAPTPNLRRPL